MIMFRALVFVGLLACLGGCTSFKTIEMTPDDPARVTQALEPGDRVRITKTSGEKVEMDVTAVGPGSVSGRQPGQDGESIEIPLGEIAELQVKEVSAVKTSSVVVATVVIAVVAIVLSSPPGFP